MKNRPEGYKGFEIGPIRPPSEAESLLLRVTRNCPWNKCRFCGLYKTERFSVRPKEHILMDLEIIKECIEAFRKADDFPDKRAVIIKDLRNSLRDDEDLGYHSALAWYRSGMRSVFLQDANTMVIKPDDMVSILHKIKSYFPEVERITSYARSHTISRMSDEDLSRIAQAGLNRIHIGMESASDEVLHLVEKGVDKITHITAGKKIKQAGIELSEYYMPGLGGRKYLSKNALETADAMNKINPDFIRIRTLAVPDYVPLAEDYASGVFSRTNDIEMAEELLLFIGGLEGITSTVKSDHILNLIPEVEGSLPEDKNKMIAALKWFLGLTPHEQTLFRIGRRLGFVNTKKDLNDPQLKNRIEKVVAENNITEENVDIITDELMKRFI